MVELNYVENDTLPAIECVYKDAAGTVIDISGYLFELHIQYEAETITINGTIVEAASGTFIFNFEVGDIRTGKSLAEIEINDGNGGIITYQGIKLNVKPELA